MAKTPEGQVKEKVTKTLDRLGAYSCKPVTGGYGASGVPDILACLGGRFIGIECKANGNKTTALQDDNLARIKQAGGIALVVDEFNVHQLGYIIDKEMKK